MDPVTLRLSVDVQKGLAQLQELNKKVSGLGNTMNSLAPKMATASRAITGVGDTSSKAVGQMGGMEKAVGKISGAVKGLVAAYMGWQGATRLLGSFYQANAEFGDKMAAVKAVVQEMPGYTEDAFSAMSMEARRLGATTRFGADQAAEALLNLAQAGFDAEMATASVEATLKLAQAGMLDMASASNFMTSTMAAFGASADQATFYADSLAAGASLANMSVGEMGEAMKYVGPIAGGLGQKVRDVGAAIGILSNVNVKGSTAGTALRGVLVQLADTSSKAYRDLAAMGANMALLNPQSNSLTTIFGELARAGVNTSNAYSLFGVRAGIAADVLTKKLMGPGGLQELTAQMQKVDGMTERMSSTMDGTLKASLMKVKGAWDELMLTLGDLGGMKAFKGFFESVRGQILVVRNTIQALRLMAEEGILGDFLLQGLKVGVASGARLLYEGLAGAIQSATLILSQFISILSEGGVFAGMAAAFKAVFDFVGKSLSLMFETGVKTGLLTKLLDAGNFFIDLLLLGFTKLSFALTGFMLDAAHKFTQSVLGGLASLKIPFMEAAKAADEQTYKTSRGMIGLMQQGANTAFQKKWESSSSETKGDNTPLRRLEESIGKAFSGSSGVFKKIGQAIQEGLGMGDAELEKQTTVPEKPKPDAVKDGAIAVAKDEHSTAVAAAKEKYEKSKKTGADKQAFMEEVKAADAKVAAANKAHSVGMAQAHKDYQAQLKVNEERFAYKPGSEFSPEIHKATLAKENEAAKKKYHEDVARVNEAFYGKKDAAKDRPQTAEEKKAAAMTAAFQNKETRLKEKQAQQAEFAANDKSGDGSGWMLNMAEEQAAISAKYKDDVAKANAQYAVDRKAEQEAAAKKDPTKMGPLAATWDAFMKRVDIANAKPPTSKKQVKGKNGEMYDTEEQAAKAEAEQAAKAEAAAQRMAPVSSRIGGNIAGAINMLMGRSANEVIADESKKQSKLQEEMAADMKKQTKIMEGDAGKGAPDAVF